MPQSILVIDDDSDTLTLIGLTLQRRGFEVIKAQSGQQAIGLLSHDLPDLVVLDVMMPHMDGYEVCREIKADPRTANLPIVMLTAKAQTSSQLEGFRAGAIDYITKPVHPQDLVARIQAVLDSTRPAAAEPAAQLIAVSGAKGGVGATTLAVNLALAVAARQRTILVDLEMSMPAACNSWRLVTVRSTRRARP
jgi:DNA-binding response OmpR family regulator